MLVPIDFTMEVSEDQQLFLTHILQNNIYVQLKRNILHV